MLSTNNNMNSNSEVNNIIRKYEENIKKVIENKFSFIEYKDDFIFIGYEVLCKLIKDYYFDMGQDYFESKILNYYLFRSILFKALNNIDDLTLNKDKIALANYAMKKYPSFFVGRTKTYINVSKYLNGTDEYYISENVMSTTDDILNKIIDEELVTHMLKFIRNSNDFNILVKHFYYNESFQDIANDLGVSKQYISEKYNYLVSLLQKKYKVNQEKTDLISILLAYNNYSSLELKKMMKTSRYYFAVKNRSYLGKLVLDRFSLFFNLEPEKIKSLKKICESDLFTFEELLYIVDLYYKLDFSTYNENVMLELKKRENNQNKCK